VQHAADRTYIATGFLKCPDLGTNYSLPFTIGFKGAILTAHYIYSSNAGNNGSVINMTWAACITGDYWYPFFILTDLRQGSANSGANKLPQGYENLGRYSVPTVIRGSLTKTGCNLYMGEIDDLLTTEFALTVVLIASANAASFGMDALITGGDQLVGASTYV